MSDSAMFALGAGLVLYFVAFALAYLRQLAEATDRIAEIMRRSHAADLDRYNERLQNAGDGDVQETPLHAAGKFRTMADN